MEILISVVLGVPILILTMNIVYFLIDSFITRQSFKLGDDFVKNLFDVFGDREQDCFLPFPEHRDNYAFVFGKEIVFETPEECFNQIRDILDENPRIDRFELTSFNDNQDCARMLIYFGRKKTKKQTKKNRFKVIK